MADGKTLAAQDSSMRRAQRSRGGTPNLVEGVIRGLQGSAGNLQGCQIGSVHDAGLLHSLPQHQGPLSRRPHQPNDLHPTLCNVSSGSKSPP